jgi:pyrimidine-nucleoside phosphorylase
MDDTSRFPRAGIVKELRAAHSGYIARMDAEQIGRAACELGAGRKKQEDKIDFAAGIVLCKKTGDRVQEGQTLAYMHTSDASKLASGEKMLASAYEFSAEKPAQKKLIIDVLR